MMKRIMTIALLAFIAVAMQAQTLKTATIKGYSPALKDGTVAMSFIDMTVAASDTVREGRFTLTFPVEKLTECDLYFRGEGCPNFLKNMFVAPDVVVSVTGENCLFPTWKVESPLPEQVTANRIAEHTREALNDMLRLRLAGAPDEKEDSAYMEVIKLMLDILPSLPVDAASIAELRDIGDYVRNSQTKRFPYEEQLKAVERTYAERAPQGYESEMAYIHSLVYPQHVVQPGEEAVDADFFDMQGNAHHLAELRGRYVLLDFWSLACGPCRMAEPEMREAREQMSGRLEIVGINRDKPSAWQENEWSKRIVWPNWSDGKMGKGGIESRYCDFYALPYYVLLLPDHRVVWKSNGYGRGMFFGLATAINGPRQDNSKNLHLAIRRVEATAMGTTVHFRYFSPTGYWFRIVSGSYLTANGKRYKLTSADGITLNAEAYTTEKASASTDSHLSDLCYADFSLTFEPFDTLPTTFDFVEGDADDAFVIRKVAME